VEDSFELLMRGEEGEIVEYSFDKIQEQDDNEEEEVSSKVLMNFDLNKNADYEFNLRESAKKIGICWRKR